MDRMQDGSHNFCGTPLKNDNIFLLHLFPFAIGLQKDVVKEAKIKENVEVAIDGFKEIGSLISKSKHNQQRTEFDRTKNAQHVSASHQSEYDSVSDMEVENFVPKKT
jgi:hypothetical protein